jgi:hypothetical protein
VQRLVDLSDSVVGVVVLLLVLGLPAADALLMLVLGVAAHAGFDVLLHRSGAKVDVIPSTTPRGPRP